MAAREWADRTHLGYRAEALRVYHRCRALLGEELGIDPSPETESLYLELLRLTPSTAHNQAI